MTGCTKRARFHAARSIACNVDIQTDPAMNSGDTAKTTRRRVVTVSVRPISGAAAKPAIATTRIPVATAARAVAVVAAP